MRTRVQKWGHSLAVRIPKALAVSASLGENTAVDVSLQGDKLVIAAVAEEALSLDGLLAAVTPENLHGEVGTGRAIGLEAW